MEAKTENVEVKTEPLDLGFDVSCFWNGDLKKVDSLLQEIQASKGELQSMVESAKKESQQAKLQERMLHQKSRTAAKSSSVPTVKIEKKTPISTQVEEINTSKELTEKQKKLLSLKQKIGEKFEQVRKKIRIYVF
jgi:hypothetical protein